MTGSANNRTTISASILLLLFTCLCIWLVFQYVATEKQRDIQHWQQQLSVIAESQKRNIEDWLQTSARQFKQLAENPLVQIFVTEFGQYKTSDMSESQRGQLHHLKNLLDSTAQRAGVFTRARNRANDITLVNDGLALMVSGKVLLATKYFPEDDTQVRVVAEKALQQRRQVISVIYQNHAGQPRLIVATPVSSVQAVQSGDFRGVVVAVMDPALSLYKIIAQQWLTSASEEAILVMDDGSHAVSMSPLQGRHLFYRTPVEDVESALVFAVKAPGEFALKRDRDNIEVLVTSRRIDNTDWILVQKIDAQEALQESISHQRFILIILLLAVFVVAVSFIAVWRHATSLRLQKTMQRLAARTELLNAVSGSIRDYIFLLDHDERLIMINDALSSFLGISQDDIKGKSLSHLYDSETVSKLLEIAGQGEVRNKEVRLDINGRRYDYHVSIVELGDGKYKQSRLYVLHNITELKDSQYRHNRLLESVIKTIIRLTDVHDPHCEKHSERTREVAVAIARTMGLSPLRTDALAMAAQLANIGKLFVPARLLTSEEVLTEEQALALRESNRHTVELLQGLDFEGPVIDIVRQKNEYLDGSGYPDGITGEEILIESRILAVANAFVAMTSSRAYRAGKRVNDVLDILFEQADTHYDRRVLTALLVVAEQNQNWSDW